jgi:molybdopterin/thiamine biosynthesis adenylyltransferase
MDETNIYERQADININIPSRVAIIGCGAVGWYVAKQCALVGVSIIDLYDSDSINEVNLNRIDAVPEDVGKLKVNVLKEHIKNIRPDIQVNNNVAVNIDNMYMLNSVSVIFECCDSPVYQELINKYAKDYNIPILQGHYNGINSITIESGMSDTEWGEMPNQYAVIPSFVTPAVITASLMVWKYMISKRYNLYVNSREVKI